MDDEKQNTESTRSFFPLLFGISTSIFAAVAYFSGRQYLENYYIGLGIPKIMLNFDNIECIYTSVSSLSIVLAFLIALLVYGIIKLMFVSTSGKDWSLFGISTEKLDSGIIPFEKTRKFSLYSTFAFCVLSGIYFFLFAFIVIIDINVKLPYLRNMIQFIYVYPCLLYGFFLTQDPNVISMFSRFFNVWKPISRYKTKKGFTWRHGFSILLFLSLFYLLYFSFRLPSALGIAKGISDWVNTSNYVSDNSTPPLPIINLTIDNKANYPQIKWQISENQSINELPLVLLMSTDTELYVRSKEQNRSSKISIIKKQDIIAIQDLNTR